MVSSFPVVTRHVLQTPNILTRSTTTITTTKTETTTTTTITTTTIALLVASLTPTLRAQSVGCRTKQSEFANHSDRPFIGSDSHKRLVNLFGQRDMIPKFSEEVYQSFMRLRPYEWAV